ncbi:gamma-glutamylcyclotransferase family protein [Ferruginibacter sp. SUN106]|uniref:gamma-glutamylcyclotransferase family protein n=1 Tax=Ferruginibacter sp. SUN106 TaxID=2978348 RepID=UPI003D35B919
MNNETYQLFVYGSLRSGFQHAAYQYIARYFHLIGDAKVNGKLYDKGDYPVAVPATEEKFIVGELYGITNPSEFSYAIGQLDDYEGLYVEAGETPLFKRETVMVHCNNQQYTAWIYWFNGSVDGLPEIATGDVLLYLQQQNKL